MHNLIRYTGDVKQTPVVQKNKPQAVGPFVAVIIIVLVVAIGGVYFFIQQEHRIKELRQAAEEPTNS